MLHDTVIVSKSASFLYLFCASLSTSRFALTSFYLALSTPCELVKVMLSPICKTRRKEVGLRGVKEHAQFVELSMGELSILPQRSGLKKHNWTSNVLTPVLFHPSPASSLPQWLCCSKIKWHQSWSDQGIFFYTQLCRNT